MVRIFERRQLVEASLVQTENGPQYLVREIDELTEGKLPLIDTIYIDKHSYVPQDVFESNFTEIPELKGCCE